MCVAWLSSPTKMARVDPSRVVQIQLTKRTELKESHFVSVLKYSKGDHDIMAVGSYFLNTHKEPRLFFQEAWPSGCS